MTAIRSHWKPTKVSHSMQLPKIPQLETGWMNKVFGSRGYEPRQTQQKLAMTGDALIGAAATIALLGQEKMLNTGCISAVKNHIVSNAFLATLYDRYELHNYYFNVNSEGSNGLSIKRKGTIFEAYVAGIYYQHGTALSDSGQDAGKPNKDSAEDHSAHPRPHAQISTPRDAVWLCCLFDRITQWAIEDFIRWRASRAERGQTSIGEKRKRAPSPALDQASSSDDSSDPDDDDDISAESARGESDNTSDTGESDDSATDDSSQSGDDGSGHREEASDVSSSSPPRKRSRYDMAAA